MEEPDEEWEDDPLSPKENGKVSWIMSKGLGLGKKIVISGIVITSVPFIVPPLLVFSAFGLAFSVPFGIYFVSYACTEKIMSKLLSTPMSSPDVPEYDKVLMDDVEISCGGDAEEDMGFGEVIDFEKEEERLRNDVEKVVEMRIELPDQGNEGFHQEGKLTEVENDEQGGVDSEEHEPMEDDMNEVARDELCEEDDEDLKKENVKPLREIDVKCESVIEEETVGHELADEGNEGFDYEWKQTEVEGYEQGDVDGKEHEPIKDEGYEKDDEDLVKDKKMSFEEIDLKMKRDREDEIIEEEVYDKEENLAQEQVISVREIDMEMEGKREEEIVSEAGYKKNELLANEKVISLEEIDMKLEGDSENGNVKDEGYAKDEDLAKTIFEAPDDKITTEGDDENIAIVELREPIRVNEENMGADKPIDIEEGNLFVSETMSMKESVMYVDCIGTTAEDDKHQVREMPGATMKSHKRNAKKNEIRDKASRIRKKYRTNKMDSVIKNKEEEVSNKLLETPEMNGGNFSSIPNIVEVEILPETRETAYVHTTVNEVNEQFGNEWKRTEVSNYQLGGVDGKDHEPMKDGVKEIEKEDNQDLAKSQVKALDMILEGDTKEDTLANVDEESTDQKSITKDLGDAMEVDDENITTVNVGEPFELTRRFNEENKGTGNMINIEEGDSKNGNHVDTIVEVEIPQETREAGNIDSIVENEQNCNVYEKDMLEVKTEESNGNNVEAVTFSNADARENVDESEFSLGEKKNAVDEHYSNSVEEASEGTEQFPRHVDQKIAADEALTVSVEVPESPSEKGATALPDKGLYSEEKIWENILALGTIVGYNVTRQHTCMEELKAIYIFTGVEPPSSSKDSSDLVELNDKLRFLMTVVGVK